jgi:hypothetical protein
MALTESIQGNVACSHKMISIGSLFTRRRMMRNAFVLFVQCIREFNQKVRLNETE